jgi:hypothetical protein
MSALTNGDAGLDPCQGAGGDADLKSPVGNPPAAKSEAMPPRQWARLKAEYDRPLRRGAWYRVLSVSQVDAGLDVHGRPLAVPLRYLEIVSELPRRWTIVERPKGSLRIPTSMTAVYAVCPGCQERVPVGGTPPVMRCRRCQGVFEVAWDQPYQLKKQE